MPYAPGRFFCTSGGTCYHSFEDHCIPGCALPLRGTKPWKNKTLDPENKCKIMYSILYIFIVILMGFQEGGEIKNENKMN